MMENPVNDIFQIQESPMVNGDSPSGISSYISCIRVNGKPILPPIITDERRRELISYKKKAIEIEARLAENKERYTTYIKTNTVLNSENSMLDVSPSKQPTPTRPVTLKLATNISGKTSILSSSSDSKINKSSSDLDRSNVKKDDNSNMSSDSLSSPKSTNRVRSKSYRSTLEQRLVNEDTSALNRKNMCEQSPIIEENYSVLGNESMESDELKSDRRRWSPLNIETINSLRVEKSSRGSPPGENTLMSLDEFENTSETVTASPSLMRQSSYTLLTPSPALLQYLENQKEGESQKRSHSGRKTWDLTQAKKKWNGDEDYDDPIGNDDLNGQIRAEKLVSSENSRSVDGFPAFQSNVIRNSSPNEARNLHSYTDDGSTSPSSYSFKGNSPKFQKIKCKIKNRRTKPHSKNVPSPKPTDKVPKIGSNSPQGPENVFVPLQLKEELNDLSSLLMKMKLDHERQKKELEEKQRLEIRELELLFKRRESELLNRIGQTSPACPRSIYSQYSDPVDTSKFQVQVIGDGKHNPILLRKSSEDNMRRPQSAKDYYSPSHTDQESRRTRSMDFNQAVPNQDTDLDVSFQDSLQSKELYVGNEDLIETDTVSNCSSRSSTMSSDSKLESIPLLDVKKFRSFDITPEEFEKYNQAASVITAAARGFLTRRLLRTAHVQGLIVTLRDAISCATQLHGASDLGESDVDLMKRLGRQIEAAWEAVYAVFFETDPITKMQLISSDRERLRSISNKLAGTEPKKRISAATLKSLRRKSGSELFMSKSQIANGSSNPRRIRPRMVASYPSPGVRYKLK